MTTTAPAGPADRYQNTILGGGRGPCRGGGLSIVVGPDRGCRPVVLRVEHAGQVESVGGVLAGGRERFEVPAPTSGDRVVGVVFRRDYLAGIPVSIKTEGVLYPACGCCAEDCVYSLEELGVDTHDYGDSDGETDRGETDRGETDPCSEWHWLCGTTLQVDGCDYEVREVFAERVVEYPAIVAEFTAPPRDDRLDAALAQLLEARARDAW